MNKQKLDNEASLSPELRHHRHNATALFVYYSKPIGIIELHGAPFSMAITLRRQGAHAARSAPVHGNRKTPPHNPRQKEKTKKEGENSTETSQLAPGARSRRQRFEAHLGGHPEPFGLERRLCEVTQLGEGGVRLLEEWQLLHPRAPRTHLRVGLQVEGVGELGSELAHLLVL